MSSCPHPCWCQLLMARAHSADYMQGTRLGFRTKEDAIHFAEKQGWDYYVYVLRLYYFFGISTSFLVSSLRLRSGLRRTTPRTSSTSPTSSVSSAPSRDTVYWTMRVALQAIPTVREGVVTQYLLDARVGQCVHWHAHEMMHTRYSVIVHDVPTFTQSNDTTRSDTEQPATSSSQHVQHERQFRSDFNQSSCFLQIPQSCSLA